MNVWNRVLAHSYTMSKRARTPKGTLKEMMIQSLTIRNGNEQAIVKHEAAVVPRRLVTVRCPSERPCNIRLKEGSRKFASR